MSGSLLSRFGTNVQTHPGFPNPFCDIASMAFPNDIRDALYFCELILHKNGPYREALRRIANYFITEIEFEGSGDKPLGREEKNKYKDYFYDSLGVHEHLGAVGLDYLGYGISLSSVLVPFRRYLICPTCLHEAPLRHIWQTDEYHATWSQFEFQATCPFCKQRGVWRRQDRRAGNQEDVILRRWSPHEIVINEAPVGQQTEYIWKIPEEDRNQLRQSCTGLQGPWFQLEHTPWDVLEAVQHNDNLRFWSDSVFALTIPNMAGLKMHGWGLSPVLVNFAYAWYVQVLQRHNEAIALDHVMPFRVLTPDMRAGGEGSDPLASINMGTFVSRVEYMLRQHRQDPARYNILPYGLKYQALGADAAAMAPKDLLDQGMQILLNAIGIPQEIYNATLSLQAAPAALRLFEANWSHLVRAYNRWLAWLCQRLSQVMSWEPATARLKRVTVSDDINRQMALLQLMQAGVISRTTGLKGQGVDFLEEIRNKLEEERSEAEETSKMQEEMDQMAQMGQMDQPPQPPPGQPGQPMPGQPMPGQPMPAGQPVPPGQPGQPMPAGPGGAAVAFGAQQAPIPNTPVMLEDLQAQAAMLAQQISVMPESQKDSTLIKLKQQNETLHLLVKSQLEKMRRDQELRGRELIRQQEMGGAPPQ